MAAKDTGEARGVRCDPIPTRLTVALTFDHDSLSDGIRRGDSPVKLSHAEFGHRVGVPRILEIWLAELRYAHAHAPGGLLTVTMHPECIGRGHRMAMLEAFIAEAKALEGVTFERLDHYLSGI